VEVDFSQEFAGSDQTAWNGEYQENVVMPLPDLTTGDVAGLSKPWLDPWSELSEREREEFYDSYFQERTPDDDDAGSVFSSG
jgi:hypothetical protein